MESYYTPEEQVDFMENYLPSQYAEEIDNLMDYYISAWEDWQETIISLRYQL